MTHLHALHFELHVVLPRRLAVLALLPAVAVAAVPHLLPRVEQHAAALRPKKRQHSDDIILQGESRGQGLS